MRCLKSDFECPGYRNLGDLLFRDESTRIIRRARQPLQVDQVRRCQSTASKSSLVENLHLYPVEKHAKAVIPALTPAIENLGAQFFFQKFVSNEIPVTTNFNSWLMQSYNTDGKDGALRSTIEAIGLSAICNISYAPSMETKAKQQYNVAMRSLRCLLSDVTSASLDSTLMTVILLGQYEVGR